MTVALTLAKFNVLLVVGVDADCTVATATAWTGVGTGDVVSCCVSTIDIAGMESTRSTGFVSAALATTMPCSVSMSALKI